MKAQRGVEIYMYFFLTLGARWEWVLKATPRPLEPPRKTPIRHCTESWVGPTAGLDGCGKPHPTTGIRSIDRPVRSESVYLKTRTKHKMQNVLVLRACGKSGE